MIAIIGAMEVEIKTIKSHMQDAVTKTIGGIDFYQGKLAGKPVVLAKCGVGKVFAAHAASIITSHFPATSVINVGVAGGIAPEVNIGDVVLSSQLVQHDVDVTAFGYALGRVPSSDDVFWQACKKLVDIGQKAAEEALPADKKLHIGAVATGDQFIHSPEAKDGIWSNFKALCAEMEGAAIAQICHVANIPFVAIRAISDKADGTAHEDFPAFVNETAEISAALLMNMLKQI